MSPQIDNIANIALSQEVERILLRIFTKYQKIIIKKEFSGGLSGGRVLEVRPVRSNGAPELPTVVKLAPVSLIQQEWSAYRQHMQNRLPRISALTAKPVLLPEAGLGGLRYAMNGDGTFEVVSLRDYCRLAETSAEKLSATLHQLFRIMSHIWSYHRVCEHFHLYASYDQVLPVNLLIDSETPLPAKHLRTITPVTGVQELLYPGDGVQLAGFAVHKVNPATQTMTMRSPTISYMAPTYFVRCRLPMTAAVTGFANRQLVDVIAGEVVETRLSRLCSEVRHALGEHVDPMAPLVAPLPGILLPNPLLALPKLLNSIRPVHIAAIHGDFNLNNILIEPETGLVSLIDFADAREDHVLHDFLRLEVEVLTRLLPEIVVQQGLPLAPTLAWFYWHLHWTMQHPAADSPRLPHPALHKPWTMLETLRRTMRNYLYHPHDASEYYQGLILYLVGALKFKNLNELPESPTPKQAAFWAATLAHALLTAGELEVTHTPAPFAALFAHLPGMTPAANVAATTDQPASMAPADLLAADRQLRALPTVVIAPVGALPPSSRMPFSRNGLFVGRMAELRQMSQAFHASNATNRPPALIITGLGGLGKTQLATEFVHRYGRFFAGGVFWLSFADPKAIPTEVAACGGVRALALRPDYAELPLEEQSRLVCSAWQSPLPRLLIFDNCEDPALFTQWRPTVGGCHIVVTSRRADWHDTPDSQLLPLDVLSRAASIDLLREHRPDADTAMLDALAEEVGDLPLALHLAGSFLARYRHVTTPERYLMQLRESSLLQHPSLQAGGHSPTEHDQHVSRTIDLSFRQLAQTDTIDQFARRILAHCAYFAPGEPIPVALLTVALVGDLKQTVMSPPITAALRRLTELGLIRWDREQVRFHRLVVAFSQLALKAEIAAARPLVEEALCTEAERINATGSPAALMSWQAHLRALVNAVYEEQRNDGLADRLWCAMGEHFRQIGEYARARICLEASVKSRQLRLGDDHAETAQSLAGLGIVVLWQGDLAHARSCFEKALAIQERRAAEHPDTATTLNQLGFLLQHQEEFEEARKYHERALRLRSQIYGDEHSSIAESLCNLAYIDYRKKNLPQSQLYLERALAIQQRVWGENHSETARVMTNLSELLQEQGALKEAQGILMQALAIQQEELGNRHPETARILTNLGEIRQMQGDRMEARTYYQQALEIFNACHGATYFRTQRVFSNLQSLNTS